MTEGEIEYAATRAGRLFAAKSSYEGLNGLLSAKLDALL